MNTFALDANVSVQLIDICGEMGSRLDFHTGPVILVIQRYIMLAVRLDPTMDEKLSRLAQETGRSKSYYVKQAISDFLDEREYYLLALAVLERGEPSRPLADVRRELGLER